MAPPAYVFSSTVARTCETPRTFAAKLYHRSVVVHRSGSDADAGCTRSATVTVAALASVGAPAARVPSTLSRKAQPGSASMAECTPTKPPPSR